jgi:hypothetical protein
MNELRSLQGFIEIGQDAAAVIEKDNTDVLGVFTGGVQTCMVFSFECKRGLVVIHDSGQLKLEDMAGIVQSQGLCRRITTYCQQDTEDGHIRRLRQLTRVLRVKDKNIQPYMIPHSFELAVSVSGNGEAGIFGQFEGYQALPDKLIRHSITELNNFFLAENSQSLRLDLQHAGGRYRKIRPLDKTVNQMLAIVRNQPDFFFNNLALLHAAHQVGVLSLPEGVAQLVDNHGLQIYRGNVVEKHRHGFQRELFDGYLESRKNQGASA